MADDNVPANDRRTPNTGEGILSVGDEIAIKVLRENNIEPRFVMVKNQHLLMNNKPIKSPVEPVATLMFLREFLLKTKQWFEVANVLVSLKKRPFPVLLRLATVERTTKFAICLAPGHVMHVIDYTKNLEEAKAFVAQIEKKRIELNP